MQNQNKNEWENTIRQANWRVFLGWVGVVAVVLFGSVNFGLARLFGWGLYLLACAVLLTPCLLLALLPSGKQRKARAEAKRLRGLQFNPDSEWDRYVQSVTAGKLATRFNRNKGAVTRQAYRQHIVQPALAARLQNPVFKTLGDIDSGRLEASGIFGKLSQTYINDVFAAGYRGVDFMQADLECCVKKRREDSKGRTYYVDDTIFKGRWLSITSNKSLASGFYLWSGNFNDVGGRKTALKDGMQPVPLENARFNQAFDVWAYDAHDVFRFLTPTLLEQLWQLLHTARGEPTGHSIALMAVGTRVQVVIHGLPDAFEPGSNLKALVEVEAKKRVDAEISVITDTIDAMYQSLR